MLACWQVECACIENGIQEVIFHFSSVANVSCFLEALQKAGHQGLHSNVAALHLHRMEERRKPNNRSGVRELLHKSLSQNAQSAPLESAAETVQPLPTTDEASSQREHPKPANGLPKLDPAAELPVALSSVAELRPDKKLVPAPSLKLALAGVPIVSPTPQDETGRRGSKLDIRPMHGTEEEKHYADIVQEYTSGAAPLYLENRFCAELWTGPREGKRSIDLHLFGSREGPRDWARVAP